MSIATAVAEIFPRLRSEPVTLSNLVQSTSHLPSPFDCTVQSPLHVTHLLILHRLLNMKLRRGQIWVKTGYMNGST